MIDQNLGQEIIHLLDRAISGVDDLLDMVYNFKSFDSDDIYIVLKSVVGSVNIYSKVNPNYDFSIIIMGLENIKIFIEKMDFIFLIDTLEFEVKSSLMEMKSYL